MLQLRPTSRHLIPQRTQQPSRRRWKPNPSLPPPRRPNPRHPRRPLTRTRHRQRPRPPKRHQPLQPRPHPRNPPPQCHQQHCQSPVTRRTRRNHGLQIDEDVGEVKHAATFTLAKLVCQLNSHKDTPSQPKEARSFCEQKEPKKLHPFLAVGAPPHQKPSSSRGEAVAIQRKRRKAWGVAPAVPHPK